MDKLPARALEPLNTECNRRSSVNGADDLNAPFLTSTRCNIQWNKMLASWMRLREAIVLDEVEQRLLPLVKLSIIESTMLERDGQGMIHT